MKEKTLKVEGSPVGWGGGEAAEGLEKSGQAASFLFGGRGAARGGFNFLRPPPCRPLCTVIDTYFKKSRSQHQAFNTTPNPSSFFGVKSLGCLSSTQSLENLPNSSNNCLGSGS